MTSACPFAPRAPRRVPVPVGCAPWQWAAISAAARPLRKRARAEIEGGGSARIPGLEAENADAIDTLPTPRAGTVWNGGGAADRMEVCFTPHPPRGVGRDSGIRRQNPRPAGF